MRPLYLQSHAPVQVSLDGPALLVKAEGAGDRRYPLCRISRIVASDSTSWTTSALLQCADQGITVTVLRSDGLVRARWTGRPNERSSFAQYWTDFVDLSDWRARYQQWRTANRTRAIRFCAIRMGWRPHTDPRKPIQAIKDATPHPHTRAELTRLKRHLYGLSQSRAVAELHRFGVPDVASQTLIPDLVMAIQWGLHPELCRRMTTDTGDSTPRIQRRTVATFFERHASTADFIVQDTLTRLAHHLRESI